MKVNIKFICREMVGEKPSGDYELPEGSSIADALERLNAQGTFVKDYLNFMIFMVNSKPAQSDRVLQDGDTLMVLRKIIGG